LVTEEEMDKMARNGASEIYADEVIITPLALDRAREVGIQCHIQISKKYFKRG